MGSVIAMVAVVTVVAGLATVTTNKVHAALTGGTPKPKRLQGLLDEWRLALREARRQLTTLKPTEMDLLGQAPEPDAKRLRARHRIAGTLRTIYREDVAHFVRQDYPKAKTPTSLALVQTADREYVYRRTGDQTFVTIDGGPGGIIVGNVLRAPGGAAERARLAPQRDGRTVHLDAGDRTLAILLKPGSTQAIEPRAFEFVDLRADGDRELVEALGFHFLLTENLTA